MRGAPEDCPGVLRKREIDCRSDHRATVPKQKMADFAAPKEGAEGYPGPPSRPIPGEDQVLVHHLGSLLVVCESECASV